MLLARESISAINPGNPVRSAAAHKLRAVVVDRSSSYVAVICALLEFDDVVDVVGMASNGVDALEVIANLQPDLILVDVEMSYPNRLSAATVITERFPDAAVVMMSAQDSPMLRGVCRRLGAYGFLDKSRIRQELATLLLTMIGPTSLFPIHLVYS